MRFILFTTLTVSTFALGLWAYKINYDSRAAHERVKQLEKAILSASKEIKILNAEWAHLNSPERLRKLLEYYFLELRLTPINPDDFISFSEVYRDQSNKNVKAIIAVTSHDGNDHDE